ncbi:type IV secretion system protein [Aliarcobacter butzleri]|uniref:type IV secretion system protein n=1 Tax=Aliarcobacter butzleri TaxID=28197 RepID=UPI001EDF6E40|nr:type IV secretion system protein [Aliarcobacter butzleri]MCG3669107.1 type IV secretion system protein [Aliarcobacter butzleri]
METNIFKTLQGIFENVTGDIQNGLYQSAKTIFDNGFFNIAFAFAIIWIGFMIAFKKYNSEEMAYKSIWTICVFSFVKLMLLEQSMYQNMIDVFNIPRNAFLMAINDLVKRTNSTADVQTIINTLYASQSLITKTIFDKGGLTEIAPFFYGFIVWFTGSLMMLVIILNTVFSIFLSEIVLSLLPLVLPTLIWKKSEYVFFSWIKLYISISLYAPFTMLFGLISIKVIELTMKIANAIDKDFEQNVQYILVLVLAQGLVIIAVFKIPNIINQLIGSSNEGSSLTSGVGTLSAGGAMVSSFSKYTGLTYTASKVGGIASKTAGAVTTKIRDTIKDKVSIR